MPAPSFEEQSREWCRKMHDALGVRVSDGLVGAVAALLQRADAAAVERGLRVFFDITAREEADCSVCLNCHPEDSSPPEREVIDGEPMWLHRGDAETIDEECPDAWLWERLHEGTAALRSPR